MSRMCTGSALLPWLRGILTCPLQCPLKRTAAHSRGRPPLRQGAAPRLHTLVLVGEVLADDAPGLTPFSRDRSDGEIAGAVPGNLDLDAPGHGLELDLLLDVVELQFLFHAAFLLGWGFGVTRYYLRFPFPARGPKGSQPDGYRTTVLSPH